MNSHKIIPFLIFLTTIFSSDIQAQKDPAATAAIIHSKNFIFNAETVLPMSAASRQLTRGEYDMKLSGDSLITYLPYFGRAYSVNPGDEGGIRFTSTKFQYTVKEKKKGGWDISFIPSDTKDVRQMNLSISSDGFGTLNITSNNRQSISYTGNLSSNK